MLEGGGAVVLKILSRDIIHKSDVGGVVTGLASQADVMAAAKKMIDAVRSRMSDARIDGLLVQQMIARPHTRELIMGVASDPAFGPMILFGAGGVAVDILDDTALALPPLDLKLAHELIARTRVSRLLRAYRNVPGVNANAIAEMLVRLSRLVCDLPEIEELDFNPVLAGPDGALAVDVRIAIAPHARPSTRVASANPRLTIRPYPRGWERDEKLASGLEVHVRPVRPSDEVLIGEMLTRVEPEDIRFRFFSRVGQFTHAFLARLTQLDYARAMAFVALEKTGREALGFVWLYADANHEKGEYAILVRSDHKGKGLGWTLMRRMIDWARSEGLRAVEGQVLAQNIAMLNMARELGFEEAEAGDDRSIRSMTLKLE
jgi:acetyltransferase